MNESLWIGVAIGVPVGALALFFLQIAFRTPEERYINKLIACTDDMHIPEIANFLFQRSNLSPKKSAEPTSAAPSVITDQVPVTPVTEASPNNPGQSSSSTTVTTTTTTTTKTPTSTVPTDAPVTPVTTPVDPVPTVQITTPIQVPAPVPSPTEVTLVLIPDLKIDIKQPEASKPDEPKSTEIVKSADSNSP